MSTSGKVFCTLFPGSLLEEGRERTLRARLRCCLLPAAKKNSVPIEKSAFDITLFFWDKSAVFWIAKVILAVMGILILKYKMVKLTQCYS